MNREQFNRAFAVATLGHKAILKALGELNSEWEGKGASSFVSDGKIQVIMDASTPNAKSYSFHFECFDP